MPLTRFEECWPLPTESLPELPQNLNIVTLTLTLWPINSGALTSLLLPHFSSSLTESLASLNLLCHSKTDARFMQDAPKAVWSIPYVSAAFFPILKHNFIAYRSSKVSDCIFEIQQLWQSGFWRVYSNCCCSSWFEREIIKIIQSSHKMYSNKILNCQESTTILNVRTKKGQKLIVCTSYIHLNVCKQMTDVTSLLLDINTWNHLTVYKRMTPGSFKNVTPKEVHKSYTGCLKGDATHYDNVFFFFFFLQKQAQWRLFGTCLVKIWSFLSESYWVNVFFLIVIISAFRKCNLFFF